MMIKNFDGVDLTKPLGSVEQSEYQLYLTIYSATTNLYEFKRILPTTSVLRFGFQYDLTGNAVILTASAVEVPMPKDSRKITLNHIYLDALMGVSTYEALSTLNNLSTLN